MTLLVAPAGAGKTLGVGGWLQLRSTDGPEATWVYGDHVSDPAHLERMLDACADAGDRDGGAGPRLLVIDDAHLLGAASLHVIDDRLNLAPESIRLLLISRWDLPLTRLVPELLGHFTILRGDVLRMDDDECASLIAEHGRSTDPAVVRAIAEYAQGWCAAVVLAARAVGASPDPVAAARRYAEHDVGVADRVASEVFAALHSRDRHVLLCVAHEEVVTAETAIHLSHDPGAGEVLAALESTGLLVTRMEGQESTGGARYRIHPLLTEVIRRRLASGGVDVEQARATVVRAVGLDVARGDLERCFDRLVAVQATDRAADVLATAGITMVTRGHGAAVATFVRRRPEVVEAHPDTWFPVALERWVVGDVDAAHHWIDRALMEQRDRPGAECSAGNPRDWSVACLRVMRARLGLESMDAAVEFAEQVVQATPDLASMSADPALLPQLLTELGITESWTGDLPRAEVNLTAAIGLCRTRNLPALAAAAASQLALTQYMAGRERASIDIANEALEMLRSAHWRSVYTTGRAALALALARLAGQPWQPRSDAPAPLETAHAADLCTRFWIRTYRARLALIERSVADAERILTSPLELPVPTEPLPHHLQVAVLVERAFLAALASDPVTLKDIEHVLTAAGAPAEAALAAGLRADLGGDRHTAARQLATASRETSLAQPPTRALALAGEAQLLAALGESADALDRLRSAVTATEVRRNAVPFLGWTRQGLPMAALLRQLHADGTEGAWYGELLTAAEARADLVTTFAPSTATAREKAAVEDDALSVLPTLSPREREVLLELARGSTYADIAANLFVSENTVKTHVSSLYSKLAASRRSEALGMARRLGLL